jgi:hypothetical protein
LEINLWDAIKGLENIAYLLEFKVFFEVLLKEFPKVPTDLFNKLRQVFNAHSSKLFDHPFIEVRDVD